MDDLLPLCEWRLGRIINTYYRSDQVIRLADIHTTNSQIMLSTFFKATKLMKILLQYPHISPLFNITNSAAGL